MLASPALAHLRALYVLAKMTDASGQRVPGFLLRPVEHSFAEQEITFPAPSGSARGRLYLPVGVEGLRGMVILHGVHRLGIEEPRLVDFARALAATGIAVMTPELTDLKDFRIVPQSVATIGAAAQELERRIGRPVGVMGLSFAGGLALLAAADPQYAPSISHVLAVGGHADMARTARFYATDESPRPDGSIQRLRAHPYGAMVLIYAHPEDFFAANEAPLARQALRLALHEDEAGARAAAAKLAPASRTELESLAVHWNATPALRAALLRSIERHRDEMAAVSPAGKLHRLRVPVFLLHGAADSVIPPSESEWLAREVPPDQLRAALVSTAISHVEAGEKPSLRSEWELLHLLAQALGAAR